MLTEMPQPFAAPLAPCKGRSAMALLAPDLPASEELFQLPGPLSGKRIVVVDMASSVENQNVALTCYVLTPMHRSLPTEAR